MKPQPAVPAAPRPFTGRHMAAIMVGFFAVVIAVNLFMAREASATFGGVVVENSYVASQHFNRWLDEAHAEDALGWQAALSRRRDGRVVLALTGSGAVPDRVTAIARHPLGRQPDFALDFAPDGAGRLVSAEVLPAGRWRLRLEVRAKGKLWRSEGEVR
ncbi:MAG: FixH family protein [Novosphingobium sp.]|nr:FixH family protein [Novosphingobium sp.]